MTGEPLALIKWHQFPYVWKLSDNSLYLYIIERYFRDVALKYFLLKKSPLLHNLINEIKTQYRITLVSAFVQWNFMLESSFALHNSCYALSFFFLFFSYALLLGNINQMLLIEGWMSLCSLFLFCIYKNDIDTERMTNRCWIK